MSRSRAFSRDLFVSMVGAGESSGKLDQILVRVSDHFANANKTNNKIKSAMVYPIILLVLALAVIVLMFTMNPADVHQHDGSGGYDSAFKGHDRVL